MKEQDADATALFDAVVRENGWVLDDAERARLLEGYLKLGAMKAWVAATVDDAAQPSNIHQFAGTRSVA